jgi:hypothetical protein
MSPLAREIYRRLLARLRTRSPSITYGELAEQVSKKVPTHRRSSKFHEALGEITITCRRHHLPAIPAIVWRAERARPSDGYFAVAHPKVRTEDGRLAAWEREHASVVAAAERYPPSL